MTYVIAEPCVDVLDLSCVSVCPVDCIHQEEGVDRKLYIDPDACIDCGSCEGACPNTAIARAERLPEAWVDFAWVDATWFVDPAAARSVVDQLVPAA